MDYDQGWADCDYNRGRLESITHVPVIVIVIVPL